MTAVLAECVVWFCIGIIAFAYVIYPLLIFLLSRLTAPAEIGSLQSPDELFSVSLLVAAHNEADCIRERVRNGLASVYAPDKLEVVIASDCSDDGTNEIVESFVDPRVRLLRYSRRRGKAATLNDALQSINSDIVVFSDANTIYEPDAIRRLVCWFSDPSVGAVCGKLLLTDAAAGRNADGVYWRYESFIKECEGRLGGLLGANGAIYAIRRELYFPIPANTIVDDFVIPLTAKLKHKFRIVFDALARAHEETAPSIGDEFRRRVRIGTGDYQSLALLWPLLHPRHGWTCVTFLCHKLLRWLSPFLLIALFVANLFLLSQPVYAGLFVAQVAFYLLAIIGYWLPGDHAATKLVRAMSLFCSVNAALLIGCLRWMVVTPTGTWQRTSREVEPA